MNPTPKFNGAKMRSAASALRPVLLASVRQCTSKEALGVCAHSRRYAEVSSRRLCSTRVVHEQEETRNIDFVAQLEKLQPSKDFVDSLDDKSKSKLDSLLKELEIYVYMGSIIPQYLTNDDWINLLKLPDVRQRVMFLSYSAVKQKRAEGDQLNKEKRSTRWQHFHKIEQEKFDRGEMGYGADLYQLVQNPLRNRKKVQQWQGSRIATSMRLENPNVVFDMQHVNSVQRRGQSELFNQVQYVMSENFESRNPLPLTFVNVPDGGSGGAQEFMAKSVGFYGGMYTQQTILPEFTTKGVKETFPDAKEIVYFSRNARDILDGPLTADVYTVCLSRDTKREALGSARRANIRAVRLPIQRYVNWVSGPMYLPFPNLMRVLREVYQSGGDWGTALHNNIAKRHLIPSEQRETSKWVKRSRDEKMREQNELIQSIQEATGNQ